MLLLLVGVLVLLVLVECLFNYNKTARALSKIPGPPARFIVGNGLEIFLSPVELFKAGRKFSKQFKGIYKFWCFPVGAVNIYNPEDIETILTNSKFNEKSGIYRFLKPWLQDGLLLSKGSKWQSRRKILTPTFHFNILRHFTDILEENSQRMIEKLGSFGGAGPGAAGGAGLGATGGAGLGATGGAGLGATGGAGLGATGGAGLGATGGAGLGATGGAGLGATGGARSRLAAGEGVTLDVVKLISDYTLNSICETAMGTRLDETKSAAGTTYKQSIYELGMFFIERFIRVYLYNDAIFKWSSTGKSQKKHLDVVHNFTRRVIDNRKDYLENNGIAGIFDANDNENDYFMSKRKKIAMLDLLILAQKDGLIDDEGIQEEVDTFMFEGHDTTAAGISFLLMLLANHQDIQDKVIDELKEILGDSTQPATIQDLSKMKYLECCIKEALRLYPPVPFISRNIPEPVTLSEYTVPGGTSCHIHIYDLHRRAELFPAPESFRPERFLAAGCAGRHPYAYIPFSAGARNCIGQRFAMLEMKSAVSSLLRQYRLQPVTTPADIRFMSDIILRNDEPVYVHFVKV